VAEELGGGALFIDLDGTLVDTVPSLYAVYEEFLRIRGANATQAEFDRYNGATLGDIVTGLARDHGFDGSPGDLEYEYHELVAKRYRSLTEPADGARELIVAARAQDAPLAIVTSAPDDLARGVLGAIAIHVDCLISGNSTDERKPHPAPYREAIRALRAEPASSVAIEDSPSGVRSATGAGLRCIAIGDPDDAKLSEAWAIRPSLTAAAPLVDAILGGATTSAPASAIEVVVKDDCDRLGADDALAQEAWDAALSRSPGLFDGELLGVAGWSAGEGAARVTTCRARYRDLIASRDGAGPRVCALGVSSVAIIDGAVIVGRRSPEVTQYAGRFELCASGTLTPESAGDPERQIRAELAEEAGIADSAIVAVTPLGLVEDLGEDCLDLCYRIDLAPGTVLGERSAEYGELRIAGLDEAAEIADGDRAVPTMRPILGLLGR